LVVVVVVVPTVARAFLLVRVVVVVATSRPDLVGHALKVKEMLVDFTRRTRTVPVAVAGRELQARRASLLATVVQVLLVRLPARRLLMRVVVEARRSHLEQGARPPDSVEPAEAVRLSRTQSVRLEWPQPVVAVPVVVM
jgi:hypothetical protein